MGALIDALTKVSFDLEWPDVKWPVADEPDPPQLLDQFGRPFSPRKPSRAKTWRRYLKVFGHAAKGISTAGISTAGISTAGISTARLALDGVPATTIVLDPPYFGGAGSVVGYGNASLAENVAPLDKPAPAVEVTVKVTARVVCSRCGAPLPAGEHTFNVTSPAGNVEIPALGLCPCMHTWDGTAGDLAPRTPTTPGPASLQTHEGDCSGDRVPRGALKAVGCDSNEP